MRGLNWEPLGDEGGTKVGSTGRRLPLGVETWYEGRDMLIRCDLSERRC